jgi:hypothetical protein
MNGPGGLSGRVPSWIGAAAGFGSGFGGAGNEMTGLGAAAGFGADALILASVSSRWSAASVGGVSVMFAVPRWTNLPFRSSHSGGSGSTTPICAMYTYSLSIGESGFSPSHLSHAVLRVRVWRVRQAKSAYG